MKIKEIFVEIPEEPAVNLLRYLTKIKKPHLGNVINLILADYFRKVLTDKDLEAIEKIKQDKLKIKLKEDKAERDKPEWDLSKKELPPVPLVPRETDLTKEEIDYILENRPKKEWRFR